MTTRLTLLLLLAHPALACDFCSGGASGFVPLQKRIDESGSVALAAIVKVRPGDLLQFRIEKVLKGARGIARGDHVTITTKTFPHPRFQFVLLGKGADFAVVDRKGGPARDTDQGYTYSSMIRSGMVGQSMEPFLRGILLPSHSGGTSIDTL